MTILLDSVILIDHFNSIVEATAYLRQVREDASISVITRAEVLTGFDAETIASLSTTPCPLEHLIKGHYPRRSQELEGPNVLLPESIWCVTRVRYTGCTAGIRARCTVLNCVTGPCVGVEDLPLPATDDEPVCRSD